MTVPPTRSAIRKEFWRNFWVSLAAVLIGNAIYFLLLWPILPHHARHQRNQIDLGLVIDFWVCLVVYGVLKFALRWRSRHRQRQTG